MDKEVEEVLLRVFGSELKEVLSIIESTKEEQNPYLVKIPASREVDLTIEDMMHYVALSSNAFGRITRFAGMARAEYKIQKGKYDRKFKESKKVGRNEAQRTANAMEATEEEHKAMVAADAIATVAESLESAAKVASESTRKILGAMQNMDMAQRREGHGEIRHNAYDDGSIDKEEDDDINDIDW